MREWRRAAWIMVAAGIVLCVIGLGRTDARDCGEGRAPGEASCAGPPAGGGLAIIGALLAFLGASWLVAERRWRGDEAHTLMSQARK